MASKITDAEMEAMVTGLNLNIHPKEIANSIGRDVRRVYEVQRMMRFAAANRSSKPSLKDRLKDDIRRIFKKNGSQVR